MNAPRVALTGLGCVCASGHGTDDLLESLRSGRSGVRIDGPDGLAWDLGPATADFEGRVSRLVLRRLDEGRRWRVV